MLICFGAVFISGPPTKEGTEDVGTENVQSFWSCSPRKTGDGGFNWFNSKEFGL